MKTSKGLGLGALVLTVAIAKPLLAQFNTSDPDAFIRGEFQSCQGCNLREADLSNQSRRNAQLRQADLAGADLSDGNFTGAYFTCSNLSNADLSEGTFAYANFVDANLSGVILDNTTNFTDANLDGAKLWDAATIYESGMDLSEIPRNTDLERQRVRCKNE